MNKKYKIVDLAKSYEVKITLLKYKLAIAVEALGYYDLNFSEHFVTARGPKGSSKLQCLETHMYDIGNVAKEALRRIDESGKLFDEHKHSTNQS